MEINKYYYLNFQLVNTLKLIVALFILMVSFNASAFFNSEIENTQDESKLNKSTVEYYQKDNITNQIPYFDNRFRLDAYLDEITLIFYRESGSTPIILIRPDGSKIRINNFDSEKVQWFDGGTFDMIKIKKPVPGPWQAIGDISPNSQIMVVSDVKIVVDPLPEIAFSGETLKVEGKLFNGTEEIKSQYFKDVVSLDVNFFSTNNTRYENFGADAIKVASFLDDGYGLDEYANDNIFTGAFVLDFAPGEWEPVYVIELPMATRELKQRPILLHEVPITISVIKSENVETPHKIVLTIDPSFVDPNSLVFQGKLTFPDRQVEPFSIMEESGETRTTTMNNTEPGIYRVNVSAFGQTITGREFRLAVPEFSFNVEEIHHVIEVNDEINTVEAAIETVDDLLLEAEQERADALLAQQQRQDKKEQKTVILMVIGNGAIFIIGVILFFTLGRRRASRK